MSGYIRSNILGFVAIFIALGGVGIAAGLQKNSVKSKQIKDGQVKSVDVADDGLTGTDIDELSLDNAILQSRVAGTCSAGSSIRAVAQNGTVTCEADDAGGLPSGAAGGDLTGSYPDPQIAQGAVTESELGCGSDPNQQMVKVGSVCIDRYEASVWSAPTGGTQLVSEAQIDAACPNNGQGCANIFARSVPGVVPARNITWFQAQQALANSGKQLPTNAEWQMAVSGTQDPGPSPGSEDCNTNSAGPEVTQERSNCFSRFNAFDMVGNVAEWVADWDEQAAGCVNFTAPTGFSGDLSCVGKDVPSSEPGALVRGGDFNDAGNAGALAIDALTIPFNSDAGIGFRGAR